MDKKISTEQKAAAQVSDDTDKMGMEEAYDQGVIQGPAPDLRHQTGPEASPYDARTDFTQQPK